MSQGTYVSTPSHRVADLGRLEALPPSREIQNGALDQGLQQVVAGRTAGVGMTPYPEGTL